MKTNEQIGAENMTLYSNKASHRKDDDGQAKDK